MTFSKNSVKADLHGIILSHAIFFNVHEVLTIARGLKLLKLPKIYFLRVCLGSLQKRKTSNFLSRNLAPI